MTRNIRQGHIEKKLYLEKKKHKRRLLLSQIRDIEKIKKILMRRLERIEYESYSSRYSHRHSEFSFARSYSYDCNSCILTTTSNKRSEEGELICQKIITEHH